MKTILVGCGEWGFRELPMERHFEIARDFGFRYLEFGIGGDQPGRLPIRLTDRDIGVFRQLGERYQIKTPFCCLENDFTKTDARAALDQILLAKKCGATHVRLFVGFTPAAEMTEALWRQVREAFAQCAKLGLTIAIETHGQITMKDGAAHHVHTASTDPACLQRLLKELPSSVGFNFDPGNLKAVAPADTSYCLDLLNDRINYCHLKDWRRKGAGWEAVAAGDDDLDYASLLPHLKFAGPYLIEYEPTGDIGDGIRRSLDYLKRLGYQLRFE